MRSYYNNYNVPNEHGRAIIAKIHKFMERLYKSESESGFSIRELTGIVTNEATYSEAHTILLDNISKHQKRLVNNKVQ